MPIRLGLLATGGHWPLWGSRWELIPVQPCRGGTDSVSGDLQSPMPRPDHSAERREELRPILAEVFAEMGYRRATTAELARRCGLRENVLYRLWPDKRAMFIAAIEHVYELSVETWKGLLQEIRPADTSTAERLLAYEAQHQGEFGFYRIVFAGLNETDDPEIRRALRDMYSSFQRFIETQVRAHRGEQDRGPDASLAAWAIIGLGTVANIGRELELLGRNRRRDLVRGVGQILLGEE